VKRHDEMTAEEREAERRERAEYRRLKRDKMAEKQKRARVRWEE